MKKFILSLFTAAGIFSAGNLYAQSFSVQYDTVNISVSEPNVTYYAYDGVVNNSNNPVVVNWHVSATNFPTSWLTSLGVCDNITCYSNGLNYTLWNPNTNTGQTHTSGSYSPNATGDFHLQIDLTSDTLPAGTYYLTVSLNQQGTTGSITETYIVNKWPQSVSNINNNDNIVLYPNPATSNINVVYSPGAGVKNIAIYNIIGKVMTFYKVTNNSSANLDISNIPSGIYFIRLLDANGNTIATRKFTRQ